MAYKLTSAAWLTRETARVKGILLANLRNGVEYSGAEFTLISDALITDGTIEAV